MDVHASVFGAEFCEARTPLIECSHAMRCGLLLFRASTLDSQQLESKHLALDTYMWMAQRFPAHFVEVELATILKQQCVAMIEAGLEQLSKAGAAFQQRQQRRVMRRKSNAKSNNERNNERRAIV